MVKEFRIVLTSPEDGRVIENRVCDVTGYVLVVTDKPKTGYEAIKVSLRGNTNVKFTIGANGSNPRTYESHVAYMDVVADVWRKEDVPGGQLEAGSHRFPFSLRFQANLQSGCELPRSFYHQFEEVGRVGNIVYDLEAKISQTGLFKKKIVHTVELIYSPPAVVYPNFTPGIRLSDQKTLCCLCCASGPISLTARIPRNKYAVGADDAIPLEVDIENGSNRQIRELKATLIRRVKYTAQNVSRRDQAWGTSIVESRHWLVAISNTPIQPGNSSSWAPPPLHIPNTGPSITNCSIIAFGYVLRVEAVIFGATNLIIEFDIFLGNVLDTSLS